MTILLHYRPNRDILVTLWIFLNVIFIDGTYSHLNERVVWLHGFKEKVPAVTNMRPPEMSDRHQMTYQPQNRITRPNGRHDRRAGRGG